MRKFEYLILANPNRKDLNEHGKEGWELVAVVAWPGGGHDEYLKREITQNFREDCDVTPPENRIKEDKSSETLTFPDEVLPKKTQK